jgi:hypothetical protein
VTPDESDWKQYDMLATTIRSSLDLVLKANIFYYAVTGAILSFYFSRPEPVPRNLRFVLVFPVLMALVLAGLFGRAASTMWRGEEQLRDIATRLKLTAYPDTVGLRHALLGSSVLLLAIAVALLATMFFGDYLGLRRA